MAVPARPSFILGALTMGAALALSASCNSSTYQPTILSPTAPYSQTDIKVGTGAEAGAGKKVTINFTGWFYDPNGVEQKGQQFGTSVGSTPFGFTVGAGNVIKGLDQGIVGMKVGGVRRLIVPPELAYGSSGASNGAIPPNATLVFDIELVDVQ